MPFTDSQMNRIKNHLEGRKNECPICGTNNWTIWEDFIAPIAIDIEFKQPIQGKFLPMVAFICSECGNVRQISAGAIGLLKD